MEIGYHPGRTVANNIISYLELHRAQHPDRTALKWAAAGGRQSFRGDVSVPLPHESIAFGPFVAASGRLAGGLAQLGIGGGDRVIIFLPMGVAMYAAMFAVQRLGAIAVFLDSWARSGQLAASAACAAPKAMISERRAFERIEGLPEFAQMSLRIVAGEPGTTRHQARLEELMTGACEVPVQPVESEQTALITFTTGSTGKPKGANRTHRFLSAQHLALRRIIPYHPGELDLPAFPIFSLNNLASGVSTLLPALDLAAPSADDAGVLYAQIRHEGVTCATLSPSMFNGLARFCAAASLRLGGLRRVVTGGAPVSPDDLRAFRAIAPSARILVLYGSTEAEPMAHIEAEEMTQTASAAPSDPEIVEDGVNVGRLAEGLRCAFLRIVDGPIDGRHTPWAELQVATGAVGELAVSGDHVCRDYYNDQEAFRRSKVVDAQGTVWHRTGDLARIDDRGCLHVVGRVNNAVCRGGVYLFPVRAEVILRRIPAVRQAAYLGLPDPVLGQRAAAAISVGEAAADREAIEAEARRLCHKNSIPVDDVLFVDEIPMDPRHHSKVEYQLLRQKLLARGDSAGSSAC